ncbi:hypothetical protein [Nitrososphaera sp.]
MTRSSSGMSIPPPPTVAAGLAAGVAPVTLFSIFFSLPHSELLKIARSLA